MHAPSSDLFPCYTSCVFIYTTIVKSLTAHTKNLSLKGVFKKFLVKTNISLPGKKLITTGKVSSHRSANEIKDKFA